jgi:hypothetical protein
MCIGLLAISANDHALSLVIKPMIHKDTHVWA